MYQSSRKTQSRSDIKSFITINSDQLLQINSFCALKQALLILTQLHQKGQEQNLLIFFEDFFLKRQIIIMKNQNFDEDSNDLFEDDLADYEDQMEEKICNQIMNHKNVVEDDADQLQRSQSQEAPRKELTEAERQARDLKLKNARKYFQVVKLTYIKEVNEALKQANFVQYNHQIIVNRLLSLLSKQQIMAYQRLKHVNPLSIKIQDVVIFIKKAKESIKLQQIQKGLNAAILFWSICQSLKLACRKIFFFDLQSLVQQTFYKLNYLYLEKALKKEAKRAKQIQQMKIQIDLKRQEEQKKQKQDYLHFQDFEFNTNSFQRSRTSNSNSRRTTSQASQSQSKQLQDKYGLNSRRQNNFMRKRNYKWAYFHIFSAQEEKWKLINSEIFEFEQQSQAKSYLLSAKPIIGFYSCRILHFKDVYEELTKLRLFKQVLLQDLTMYFYDNMKSLNMRRKRVGVKFIMKDLFEKGSLNKNRFLLQNYDQHVMAKNDEIEVEFQMSNFPKNKQEMLNSEWFIIPSLLPQYSILDPKANPIDKQFFEQKVYLKRDLISATSRMVWIDRGRKVKPDQIPVKKTENKSKNMSELFLYEQTEPYHLSVDESTGNFIPDDQYNSIYIPPQYKFDEKFQVITKSIASICNKHNFRYVRLVQGFTHTIGRILPNYIGFLVYKQDKEKILQLWEERQRYLQQNKQRNREKYLISLWTKLFTRIELSQWSHNFLKT